MSEGLYTYCESKPVGNREECRMRLYVETYLLWANAQANGRTVAHPETGAAEAVKVFDEQFPVYTVDEHQPSA